MVLSLETTGAYAAIYTNLVAHVEEWGEPTSASKLSWKTWLTFMRLFLPARVWRLCPNFSGRRMLRPRCAAHISKFLCE